ncbi:hypothetical protein [Streptomyces sp. NPDC002521]
MPLRNPLAELRDAVAAGRDQYELRLASPNFHRLAAYAYVAEQFGYRYMGAAPGTSTLNQPLLVFRRAEDLRARAAETLARYPHFAEGGPLPGMVPGKGLHPSGEAKGEVGLLHSRLVVDAARRYSRRVLRNLVSVLVLMAVVLFFPGYTVQHVLVAGGIWLGLFALYLIGLGVSRLRLAKHGARLAAAGIPWPPSGEA